MKKVYLLSLFLFPLLFPFSSATGQQEEPFFIAQCQNGRQVIGHRLILEDLPGTRPIRFSAIGSDDFDPTIAILKKDGTADCALNTPEITGSVVAVPSLGRIEANNFSAQKSVAVDRDRRIELIVGGFAGQSGQYALVIENLGINYTGEVNSIRVQVPPSTYREWIGMFMIGEVDTLDPLLQVYAGGVGTLVQDECDNAGTQSCPSSSTLVDRGALFTSNTYIGDDFDAGIMNIYDQSELSFTFRDAGETGTGDYIAIMTGTAPGAVASRIHICDTVEIELIDSSPAYNPAYTLDNILDGSPDTFWVTGAAPINAEGVREENAYVVINILEERPINRIRINGYAALEGIENNSLKSFALRFPDAAASDIVTALEADLALRSGYQSFSFLPTRVEEVALVLTDNYGGTLYVLVDIEICGVP